MPLNPCVSFSGNCNVFNLRSVSTYLAFLPSTFDALAYQQFVSKAFPM